MNWFIDCLLVTPHRFTAAGRDLEAYCLVVIAGERPYRAIVATTFWS